MKKKIFGIILLVACLFICACGNNKEYKLIEITGEELVNNLYDDDKKFIFVIVNNQNDDYDDFMNDLNSVLKSIRSDIYYIDYNFLDIDSSSYLYLYNDYIDFSLNAYFYVNNGAIEIANSYSDFTSMFKNLKSISNTSELELVSDSTKESYLNEASKLYEEGDISLAFNYLCKAWSSEEAKEVYENNLYYKLMITWENYDFLDDDMVKVAYTSLTFLHNTNYYYKTTKSGEFDGFEKPDVYDDYDKVYYYVKDDIIYTSDDQENYDETYQIDNISTDRMVLIDLKDGNKYNYNRRS